MDCAQLARNATRDRVGATNAAPFMEKHCVRCLRVIRFPELPWACQRPYISLQTLANRLHEKQLSWPAFFDDTSTS